ncbi:PREDICTED: pre-rRNA-processing protein TSR2 homolog [Tarenaya hassleriana]|uniref:pre-rRNA-processing protein TSR2 homolog n=1 Tax=Tarenaya hassleriana TaxID=28532 RepID=UPI00053C2978|nr:PREDICTED: pre-rRNA-processing protein TSR2 homolog [Tarenaya hassleriana]
MDPNAAGPVVLSAEEQTVLNEGIGLLLSRWPAMRAAVENGWGGRDSHRKAEGTVAKVFDFFTQSKDPMDFDSLADILEGGLDELNTVADDGSLEEVTEKLLDLYEECLDGNCQTVEKLRGSSSQMAGRANVVKVGDDDEESDDEDEDENEQPTDMMVDDATEQRPDQTRVEPSSAGPEAEDGWTVVPARRNKGKRT